MIEQENVVQAFRNAFGSEPEGIGMAPGRVNLIGEYTDIAGGLVLPVPLPRGTGVAVSRKGSGLVAVSDVQQGQAERALGESADGTWTDYILGAIACAGIDVGTGLQVSVISDLPAGASVSSSAALCVAMVRALADATGTSMDDRTVALIAQRVENDFVGLNCGLMDQMVCAAGRQGQAMYFDTRSGAITHHDLIADTELLTIHSGQSRRLVDGGYNARAEGADRARRDMELETLRDGRVVDLERVTDPGDMALARHLVTENDRVAGAAAALDAGDAGALGRMLNEGHQSLSRDFRTSTPQIDDMVAMALDQGALGARITGAGFGGCFLVLARKGEGAAIADALIQCWPDAWLVAKIAP